MTPGSGARSPTLSAWRRRLGSPPAARAVLPAVFGAGCDGEPTPDEVLERVGTALVADAPSLAEANAFLLAQGISTGLSV